MEIFMTKLVDILNALNEISIEKFICIVILGGVCLAFKIL